MIQNYFKTAWRNLWNNKTSSAINIFGLTIGLTCCFLIALYIKHQLSFDQFQVNRKRIARVIMEYQFTGSAASTRGNFTSVRVAPVLKRNFDEVDDGVRMQSYARVVQYHDKLIDEPHFMYADPAFFAIFSFRLNAGDAQTVLAAPFSVVITAATARKYFGNENPVGKMLRVGTDSNLYQVTGVVQNCPANSQIQFDFVASFSSLGITKDYEDSYSDANYVTYLLLKDRASMKRLQSKLPAFMKKETTGQGWTLNMYLEPFDKIHLHSPYAAFVPNTSISYIYILGAVALLILFIACCTYVNLATARSMERAREVGVRKVVGAAVSQLFWQFIGESLIICILSVLLSLAMALLLLPSFNQLTGDPVSAVALSSPAFLFVAGMVIIGVSLAAGSYPALALSRLEPVKVLKGSFKNTGAGQWLRRSLIVFQFVISVFLIVATVIVKKQLNFIQHKDLGYDRNQVLVLPLDENMLTHVDLIKQEFKTNVDIISVARCVRSPVEGGGGYNMRSSTMPEDQQLNVTANPIDEDFVPTMGLEIVAGTNFTHRDVLDAYSNDWSKDIYHFILNESAVKQLGWTPRQAVNKKLFMGPRVGYVKAVVKDFHFESMHEAIKPFVLFTEKRGHELLVKVNGRHLDRVISFLASTWKSLIPDRPFEFRFLDDDYNNLYTSEIRLGHVMDMFSVIAIVLACLGLFGLTSYAAQQRIKEIGIRKVLGASVKDIVFGLSSDFITLTIIAIVVAEPIAWWATTKWMQDFSYRVPIHWSIYLWVALATILLTIGTVGLRAIQAALAKPVKSLRTE